MPLIDSFVLFLTKCFKTTAKRAEPNGAFSAYKEKLIVILDILEAFSAANFPPTLFHYVVSEFGNLAYYIGNNSGQSHAAYETWKNRCNELSNETINEINNICNQYHYTYLGQLMERQLNPRS